MEMSHPFQRFFWTPATILREFPLSFSSSAAPMDWIETPTSYTFRFDVPGFGRDDIKVQLEEGNVLHIRGEAAKEEGVGKEAVWRVAERGARGEVDRMIGLPEDVRADQIRAQVENGVLTVVVPKEPPPAKAKPRTIPVSSKL